MSMPPVHGQIRIVQMLLDHAARVRDAGTAAAKVPFKFPSQHAAKTPAAAPVATPRHGAPILPNSAPPPADRKSARPTLRDPRVIDNTRVVPRKPKPRPRPVAPPALPPDPAPPAVRPPSVPIDHIKIRPPETPSAVPEPPIAPPADINTADPADPPSQTSNAIVLDHAANQTIKNLHVNGTDFGVVVGNGQHSSGVTLDQVTATNCTGYGMYLGDVADWTISDSTFHQAPGASEHGMRIGSARNVRIDRTTVDSSQAGKTSLWLVDVDGAQVANSTFNGGAIRFASTPGTGLGEPAARNITLRDSKINKISGGDLEAILAWPGSHDIHLANLDITLETAEHWLAIDSRNTSNITWENIRVNGRLISGFEGVGMTMSVEEAMSRGIGPSSAPSAP